MKNLSNIVGRIMIISLVGINLVVLINTLNSSSNSGIYDTALKPIYTTTKEDPLNVDTITTNNYFSNIVSGPRPGLDKFDQMKLILTVLTIITIPLLVIKNIRNNNKHKLRIIGIGGWILWILLSLIIFFMKVRLREGQPI